MISGGLLRWRAVQLIQSTTADALGIKTNTWADGAVFRVDMRESAASEQQYADGVAVVRSVEIRARWQAVENAGLTEANRLSVRGRTLKINAIRNLDERDRVAVIDCTEVD